MTSEELSKLSFAGRRNGEELSWTDPDGAFWDDPVSYLQGYVLDMCCCGDPEVEAAI